MLRLLLCLSLLLPASLQAQGDPAPPPDAAGCRPVQLPTVDGLMLAADHCPAKAPGAPVALLLHMIPPHNNRSNYPVELRSKLVQAGFEVLNLDRRGAGDSQGTAKDAYRGPKGKRDVQAALDWLRAHGTGDVNRWACVGASNGTTSCLDYAAHAENGEGLMPPGALVFLTGGPYTEAQTRLEGSLATHVPLLFVFNQAEAEWSEAQRKLAHDGPWEWLSLTPGAHGTRAFASNPELMDRVAAFLSTALPHEAAPRP